MSRRKLGSAPTRRLNPTRAILAVRSQIPVPKRSPLRTERLVGLSLRFSNNTVDEHASNEKETVQCCPHLRGENDHCPRTNAALFVHDPMCREIDKPQVLATIEE